MSEACRPDLDVDDARRAERRVALRVLLALLIVVAVAVARQLWWV
jgi:hypothetical protein